MDWTPVIVLSLVIAVIGAQLLIRYKALQAKGRSAAPLQNAIPDLNTQETSLVFCYSPGCAPCKTMIPAIDELAANNNNVHKLDISQHMDLAREIGIRATPTTLLIERGNITQVLLGAKTLKNLREQLGLEP
ncbi:MAG TPA: thioredoxin [Chromatiaceae bacterium]|nr:thioredoxin [Chromatiaceae bacterium]